MDLLPEAKLDTRNVARPRTSAWRVYQRLLGYAWHYKFRLMISVMFAVVVAASFSSIILSVGAAVKLLYVDEQSVDAQLEGVIHRVEHYAERMEKAVGWAPRDVDARLRAFVHDLRAQRQRTLIYLSAAVILFSLAGGLARFLQEYFAGTIGANVSVRLGEEMFENIMRLSIPFFEQRTSGEILARFTNDVFMVNRGLTAAFVKLFREPIKALFFLILALSMDWALTLTVLLVLPVIAYVIVVVGQKIKKSVRRTLERVASIASVVSETLKGIAIVKAYCMEAYETARVKVVMEQLRRSLKKVVKAESAIEPSTEFLMVIGVVLFVLLANRAVESGRVDSAGLTVLFGALAAMMDPLRKLSAVNNMIQTSVASAERVFEFIDLRPEIVEARDAIDLPPLRETLRFEGVRFSYDGAIEVLKGVDFEVKKGEMVALVGFSGAGKSTIVKLIPRFYDASAGRITIDGMDIRRATFTSLRDQISLVTQETILFNETIRDNIAFGRECYSDQRVRQAADAAHAAEFIERLPEQYATVIGESGGTLSGGQRQRLAIARAVVKDPAILILDEATSSLDSESEHAIQTAIEEFVVGRTTLVIAHRLSTVRRADRILVVDEGRVSEQGTHQQLLALGGLYRRLYDVQFASAEHDRAI